MNLFEEFYRYLRPTRLAVLFLGFSSGLPLALTASTLTVWLAESNVDKAAIGLFAVVATPYALKFLWAPLVDGLNLPGFRRLGRRRGWLAASQLLLMLSLLMLGLADPAVNAWWTALAAVCVAFSSATQDIVIDAYRVELLAPEEQGEGAAMVVLGYRFGMIASSAGALFIAAYHGWFAAYAAMALLVPVGMVAVLFAGEPETEYQPPAQRKGMRQWLHENVAAPFADFMQRPQWLTILLFILLYKFADAFIGIMSNPFLIEIGFKKEEIASIVKLYGLVATIAGGFIGGTMVHRLGMTRSLWICGIAHGLTNLMFYVQALVGHDMQVLALGITLENVTGGMGTAAFVAYISSLTHVRFTATQYALLSSFSAFGRTWLSAPAGWVAQKLGWELFFILSALLALPGLALLWWMERQAPPNGGVRF